MQVPWRLGQHYLSLCTAQRNATRLVSDSSRRILRSWFGRVLKGRNVMDGLPSLPALSLSVSLEITILEALDAAAFERAWEAFDRLLSSLGKLRAARREFWSDAF